MVGQATRGGKIHLDEFDVSFDWSKLKKEFKERS